MQYISAKTMLSAYHTQGWLGSSYTINPYRGCNHDCIYCDSRSECYGEDDFDTVKAKENALVILEKELKGKRRKGVILTGGMSDPYNSSEKNEKLTQQVLKLIDKYGYGASLLTKSCLVTRDIEILKNIQRHSPAVVCFSVTTSSDALSRKIEPHAPVTSRRLASIKELSSQGILCGVVLMPVLPFITDSPQNIREIVRLSAESGARFIYCEKNMAVSLRDRQRTYYYTHLDHLFPGLKERYIKTYGTSYWCPTLELELYEEFTRACREHGIEYEHTQINALISQGYVTKQLHLF